MTVLEIQKEMLEAMTLGMMPQTLRMRCFSRSWLTKQMSICIRWVDDCFVIHEDFPGIHPLERTAADQVVAMLKNALLRMNLNIQRARG